MNLTITEATVKRVESPGLPEAMCCGSRCYSELFRGKGGKAILFIPRITADGQPSDRRSVPRMSSDTVTNGVSPILSIANRPGVMEKLTVAVKDAFHQYVRRGLNAPFTGMTY